MILNDISGGGSHSDPYFYSISKGFEKAVKSGDSQKVLRFLNEKKIANKVESKFLLAQMEVKARQPFSLISKEDLDNVEKNWDHLRPHPWAVYYIENFYHGQSKTAPAFFVEETLKLEKNANLIMVASIVAILLVIIFSFTAFYLKDRRSAFPITA